jgi:hypothetical protein
MTAMNLRTAARLTRATTQIDWGRFQSEVIDIGDGPVLYGMYQGPDVLRLIANVTDIIERFGGTVFTIRFRDALYGKHLEVVAGGRPHELRKAKEELDRKSPEWTSVGATPEPVGWIVAKIKLSLGDDIGIVSGVARSATLRDDVTRERLGNIEELTGEAVSSDMPSATAFDLTAKVTFLSWADRSLAVDRLSDWADLHVPVVKEGSNLWVWDEEDATLLER